MELPPLERAPSVENGAPWLGSAHAAAVARGPSAVRSLPDRSKPGWGRIGQARLLERGRARGTASRRGLEPLGRRYSRSGVSEDARSSLHDRRRGPLPNDIGPSSSLATSGASGFLA